MPSTRSQALPGNADPEALPRLQWRAAKCEAEPLDIGSQAEPGNQLTAVSPNRHCRVLYFVGFNNPEVLLLPSGEI